MSFTLPRSRLAMGTLAACLGIAGLVGAAAMLVTGQAPIRAVAAIGGPFALVNQDGKPVTQADFSGRPYVVFFGYTHCPDVCPTMLADMTALLKALGPDDRLPVLFVTVDPERDTPGVLKAYLSSFDSHIQGLTGDPSAVGAAEKAFRVYAKKVPAEGGDYSMDHTAVVYLMDKDGRFVSALNVDQSPEAAARELRRDL